ncbi:AAA family ATPase, partial [bacterium]|nr:AAA family ATPase [bacterium]
MAKIKTKYVCQNCGYETAGYLGKCPECSSWGSFIDEIDSSSKKEAIQEVSEILPPMKLSEIEMNSEIRISTNISEFDRVLGGGIVQGSLVLIAGDPGIGKSTILLQTSGELCAQNKTVLYVSAEESASQVKLRAERLGVKSDNLYIYPQTNYELIKKNIESLKPDLVIVDSIQAIYTTQIQSSAGSVSQIRECCNLLMQLAKSENISVIVIGHVTKEGNIAGP